jgi:hypothetical protein
MWRHPAAAPAERDWTLPIIAYLNRNGGRELFERVAAHEREPLRAAWSKTLCPTLQGLK